MTGKKCFLPLAVFAVLALLCGTASAGIDPVPFHLTIANRTNQLLPTSPFYNNQLHSVVVRLNISVPGAIAETRQVVFLAPPESGLMPGQVVSFAINPTSPNMNFPPGGQIESWTVKAGIDPAPFRTGIAVMGIDPSPFVFAYTTRVEVNPDLAEPPELPAAYFTGPMYFMAFASPGVEVGSIQMVADDLPTIACPVIPPAGQEWKNHGQYVRCVSHQAEALVSLGMLTTEQADALVAAAAQSEVGKR